MFKTEAKLFWEVFVNCQGMVADENNIPPIKQTFKSGSHEGRYFYQQVRSSLFLFYLHMQIDVSLNIQLTKCEEIKRLKL